MRKRTIIFKRNKQAISRNHTADELSEFYFTPKTGCGFAFLSIGKKISLLGIKQFFLPVSFNFLNITHCVIIVKFFNAMRKKTCFSPRASLCRCMRIAIDFPAFLSNVPCNLFLFNLVYNTMRYKNALFHAMGKNQLRRPRRDCCILQWRNFRSNAKFILALI